MNNCLRAAILAAAAAACLMSDVTYTQTMKYTGGTLRDGVQRMASNPILGRLGGANLRNAFQDQTYTVFVKGSKMARLGGMFSTIYDLDAGTITTINNEKHSYTVTTFDEMRQQMERMQQRMNKNQQGDVQFDVKVDKTGQTRNIDGQTATETLMTLTAKSANASGQMVVKVDAWVVPLSSATRELSDYSKRLAEKFSYAFAGWSPALGAAGGGINAAMREAQKLDGYAALSDISVSGVSSPMAGMMGSGKNDPDTPLLQMEDQSSNFTQTAVDDAKFNVPPDYKQEKQRH